MLLMKTYAGCLRVHGMKTKHDSQKRLAWSRAEVAAMLGLSLSGIDRLIRHGKLRTIRMGFRRLIPHHELEHLLGSDRR